MSTATTRPEVPLLVEGLGRDVRADIKDLRHAEERAFRVLHRVDDVIAERRHPRLAAEVAVRVAQFPRFERLRVLPTQLLNVDVFQVRLWRCRETDPRSLEELYDLARVSVNRPVRFVVDHKVEVEGCELGAEPAIHEERLDRRDDDRRPQQLARAPPSALIDDRLVVPQHDPEILHRLLCELNPINNEQDPLSVPRREETPDERRTEQRLAGSGRHLQEELPFPITVELSRNFVSGIDLISAQVTSGLNGFR
jgi:hypothetical protein